MGYKILIGSMQFSPIYKSHCCALGKQCESMGHEVRYIFSNEYNWMLPDEIKSKTEFIGSSKDLSTAITDGLNFQIIFKLKNIVSNYKPNYVYMYNIQPFLNYYLALLSKRYGTKYIQHIHEPYVEDKKLFGGFKQYWLLFFELFQEKLLEQADLVIVSSKRALHLFNIRYKSLNKKCLIIPLIYEDLGTNIYENIKREYITFIGPPVPSKSPETFLRIIDYSNDNQLGFKFLLISREPITDLAYLKDSLEIFSRKMINDEEIGRYLQRSLMTIVPYKFNTQSSVVLTSYMHGTPVIATNIGGIPEVVSHLKTGYLLDQSAELKDWIKGFQYIEGDFCNMSKFCREYFLREFRRRIGKNN